MHARSFFWPDSRGLGDLADTYLLMNTYYISSRLNFLFLHACTHALFCWPDSRGLGDLADFDRVRGSGHAPGQHAQALPPAGASLFLFSSSHLVVLVILL